MSKKKNYVEMRKWHRFNVKEGAIVEFKKPRLFKLLKPRIVKFAPIIDISRGGLAFQYIDDEMWPATFNILSLRKTSEGFDIDNIPIRIVSDRAITSLSGAMFIRRCGIKFEELASFQKSQIDSFISIHTLDRHFGTERRDINNGPYRGIERRRGRRSGLDRRLFSYAAYMPDRRSGQDRRVKISRSRSFRR